ncbi:MAG TPA: hypothetical protein VKY22_04575 [Bradyrhizobium sp.]|nr:hypothetical protein [Bradyrhizobium sp.]
MDCRWFAHGLSGAFDRARALIVPLAHVCWMSVPVAMVAWGNHAAASLTVSIDFVAFRQWMRDTGRSAWWIVPFFVLPIALTGFAIYVSPGSLNMATALKIVAAGLYFWGVAEISGLLRMGRGHPIPAGPASASQAPATSTRV